MNQIVNKYLVVGDKFMPEMDLKQPSLIYSACDPFTKNKERIEHFIQTGNTVLFIKMNLIKSVFNMIWVMEKQKI